MTIDWHPKAQFPEHLKEADLADRQYYFSETFFLEHFILEQCQKQLRKCLFKPSMYPIVNVIGPTGAGKTALAKDVAKYCFEEVAKSGETRGLPAVYVEVPMLGGNQFDWKGLYLEILDVMNAPPREIHRRANRSNQAGMGGTYTTRHRTESEVRKDLEERIMDSHLKVLILDEIQHLFKYSAKNAETSLDVLKSIANKANCQMVLIGTYENLSMMNWSAQLKRRTVDVHFRRYLFSGSEKKQFALAYSGLLAHVPYRIESRLLAAKTVENFYIYCCGCVGVLKQIIEKSIDELPVNEALTYDLLMSCAPSPIVLREMAEEIEYGEEFFDDNCLDDVSQLLGLGSNKNKKIATISKPKKTKTKPGMRKPERDAVL
tara:strand:+ start:3000 stop:4124 length:1125 start_codon:yes stop_codon:yes gene_type:complete